LATETNVRTYSAVDVILSLVEEAKKQDDNIEAVRGFIKAIRLIGTTVRLLSKGRRKTQEDDAVPSQTFMQRMSRNFPLSITKQLKINK
jgi:hypothetical protein